MATCEILPTRSTATRTRYQYIIKFIELPNRLIIIQPTFNFNILARSTTNPFTVIDGKSVIISRETCLSIMLS